MIVHDIENCFNYSARSCDAWTEKLVFLECFGVIVLEYQNVMSWDDLGQFEWFLHTGSLP